MVIADAQSNLRPADVVILSMVNDCHDPDMQGDVDLLSESLFRTEWQIYFLDVAAVRPNWVLLRTNVNKPSRVGSYTMWDYATAFAIDLSPGGDQDTLWLMDYENHGQWLATGVWKSTDGGVNWNRYLSTPVPLRSP